MSERPRADAARGRRHGRARARAATTPERGRAARALRSGPAASSSPLLTDVLAFFIGGLVVLATTGKNPLTTYQAIFDGSGLNWFFEVGSYEIGIPFTDARVWFPWNTNDFDVARGAQPPADADRLRAAHPHGPRGRVRVPLRHVQHRRPGPVPRRRDRRRLGRLVELPACRGSCTSCSRSSPARSPGRSGPGSPASSRRRSARTR